MCGIVGFLSGKNFLEDSDVNLIKKMTKTLAHRGPDGDGVWVDSGCCIALGHRRLSILDLSSNGKQPMSSGSGRYVISFNGEIYNHLEIRSEMGDYPWVGSSDTETLLWSFEKWGVEESLKRAKGMFALALWDKERRQLILARDRVGEKPLYYGRCRDDLVFASELKAIRAYTNKSIGVDRESVALLMKYGYVPAPHSINENIKKLKPGTFVVFDKEDAEIKSSEPREYWSMSSAFFYGVENRYSGNEPDAKDELLTRLKKAVQRQVLSDVPIGAFLSGGIDSSLVVALMQDQLSVPVNTFTIGFDNLHDDEAPYAKEISKHLGTNHTELYVNSSSVMSIIPRIPDMFDEPIGDSSQLPTYLVSALAKKSVSVVLTGDGGDEFFCGYNHYLKIRDFNEKLLIQPAFVRAALAGMLDTRAFRCFLKTSNICLETLGIYGNRSLGERLGGILSGLRYVNNIRLFQEIVTRWPANLLLDYNDEVNLDVYNSESMLKSSRNTLNFTEQMMFMDSIMYLPDDVLVKVDRSSMACGLETRAPLLDHEIVEFAFRLPLEWKIKGGVGKNILREILYQFVPKRLLERPKKGFSIPVDTWLKNELSSWADDLLDPSLIKRQGFFDHKIIDRRWSEHKRGVRNWRDPLWTLLMFQAWLCNNE